MKIGLSLIGVNRYMGGNFQYAMSMLHDLVHSMNGNDLIVFYDNPALMDEPNFRFLDVKYIYIECPADPWSMLRRLMRLLYGVGINVAQSWARGHYAELDRYKCDVIFHPYWGTGAFITRTPAIASIHDCGPRESPDISWQTKLQLDFLIRSIVRHARIILVDSEHGRNLLSTYYRVPFERIAILPFRPPYYLMRDIQHRTRDVMEKYSIEPGYLFLPGRWGSYKNTERVLAALKWASMQGLCQQHLVLVGLRNHEVLLAQQEIARIGLLDRVHILGFVPDDDMASLYRGALALIFPTLLGPTSIPVYEALALECPIIVSNISGYPEQVGNAGLLVDPYSIKSIAEAIIRVVNDSQLRIDMQAKGKKQIQDLLCRDYGHILLDLARLAVCRP